MYLEGTDSQTYLCRQQKNYIKTNEKLVKNNEKKSSLSAVATPPGCKSLVFSLKILFPINIRSVVKQ